jgi:hypothetical protein
VRSTAGPSITQVATTKMSVKCRSPVALATGLGPEERDAMGLPSDKRRCNQHRAIRSWSLFLRERV